MAEQVVHPLVSEIRHWNEVIALRYRQLLEAATALDLEAANRHLAIVKRLLQHSLQFSEAHLLPLVEEPVSGTGVSSDHHDHSRLVRADHMILGRTLELVADAVRQLEQVKNDDKSALRSALVERLDVFVRLDNILSRHHQRQLELVTPAVENVLSEQQGSQLASELGNLMQPLKLH